MICTLSHSVSGSFQAADCLLYTSFLDDFYQDLAEELRIPRAAERLPLGCEATVREAGGLTYRFYLNHFGRPASVDVGEGGWDLVSGQRLEGEVELPGRGVMILESHP